ncbi:MAG: hypothetical protein ABSC42_03120 [Tepidisphaeraceae bacterium]|jgi:hypothetical protein
MNPALARFDHDLRPIRVGNNPEVFDDVTIPFAMPFRPNILRAKSRIRAMPGHAENHAVSRTK